MRLAGSELAFHSAAAIAIIFQFFRFEGGLWRL